MMADLRALDAEPLGTEVIELLEATLAKANNGELSSIAIAAVKRDGSPDWNWSTAPNTSTLLGVVERMKAGMIRTADVQD